VKLNFALIKPCATGVRQPESNAIIAVELFDSAFSAFTLGFSLKPQSVYDGRDTAGYAGGMTLE
jgi:hypothetical protein